MLSIVVAPVVIVAPVVVAVVVVVVITDNVDYLILFL